MPAVFALRYFFLPIHFSIFAHAVDLSAKSSPNTISECCYPL
jgi:hypothetical protein